MWEYLEPEWFKRAPRLEIKPLATDQPPNQEIDSAAPPIDRTVKLYIGGKQTRPDSGYSVEVRSANGGPLGASPPRNPKDNRHPAQAPPKAVCRARTLALNPDPELY